jgi:hypothetical protein
MKILERIILQGQKAWKMTDQTGTPYIFTDSEMVKARTRAFRYIGG